LRRIALQARSARRQSPGCEHRARARVDGRRGGQAPAPPYAPRALSLAFAAGRARLPAPGPAGDNTVGRGGATAQDRARAGARQRGTASLYPGRADDWTAPRRYPSAESGARPPRGCRAHGARHRAQHRCHQARRLADRPGAGSRESGWSSRGRWKPRGRRQHHGVCHRKVFARSGVTRRRADLLLITAAAVWGVSFVVVKGALSHASPLLFLAFRFTIAAVVLAPFIDLRGGFSRGELRAGAVLTALLASGFATQAYGLQYTTPARSAFIVAMSSVLAPLIALIVLKHRTGWM